MDQHELTKCVGAHGKSRPKIAEDLGVRPPTLGRWMRGERKISEPDAKLLRLYFYGEIPFGLSLNENLASTVLDFNEDEWKIIKILSCRAGFKNPVTWIRERIRGYLENHPLADEARKEGGSTTYSMGGVEPLRVAEDERPLTGFRGSSSSDHAREEIREAAARVDRENRDETGASS